MKQVTVIILLLYAFAAYGQINRQHNGLRIGDEIIKQQVEYKDPGRSGENVIWDFGELKSINSEYSLVYSEPYLIDKSIYILGRDTIRPKDVALGDIVIGTEHNTMYYYRVQDNRLWLLGHENPTTLLHYSKPLLAGVYPTDYLNEYVDSYSSEGLYSSRVPFRTEGQVEIGADAYGMMVLPGGDTLSHVMRVKSVQSISEVIKKSGDTNTQANTILETYKWYAKGYRYPVFETVRTYNSLDTTQRKNFETSFFFPPQDHFYLDDDKENLAVLDSLWNMNRPKVEDLTDNSSSSSQMQLSYNFYPNPVQDYLTVEYYLEQATSVNIMIYSLDGKLVKTITQDKQPVGLYTNQLDCSNLAKGTYILKIQTEKHQLITEKIIKL